MPAAQLEIVTAPHPTVAAAARRARAGPAGARGGGDGRCRIAGGGAAPVRVGPGALNPGPRYEAIGAEYATVARRQLIFGLHVHVAIPGADRALAIYNALRSYLPDLAALGRQRAVLRGP